MRDEARAGRKLCLHNKALKFRGPARMEADIVEAFLLTILTLSIVI